MRTLIGLVCGLLIAAEACGGSAPPVKVTVLGTYHMDNPGLDLHNAKIFAKLMNVVKPGDRVVVLFGSGHKHWLEHLARNTPGFEVVDPVPYLRR